MTIDTSREAVERILDGVTPGPWEYVIGHSDWGLPRSNAVVPVGMSEFDFDAMIAEVHSTTPYCAGSSRKDRERSATADANARFIAAARELVPSLLAERDAALAEVARLSTPPDDAEVARMLEWILSLPITPGDWSRLSGFIILLAHAHAAERKLADDAKRLLEMAQDRCGHNFVGAEYPTFVDFCDAHAARRNEETPAKHGSKT